MSEMLERSMGRVEGKLDSLHESVKGIDGKVGRIDGRLQAVKRKAAIGASVISAAVSAGVSLIAAKMRTLAGG